VLARLTAPLETISSSPADVVTLIRANSEQRVDRLKLAGEDVCKAGETIVVFTAVNTSVYRSAAEGGREDMLARIRGHAADNTGPRHRCPSPHSYSIQASASRSRGSDLYAPLRPRYSPTVAALPTGIAAPSRARC
jgi:hypothetical protein